MHAQDSNYNVLSGDAERDAWRERTGEKERIVYVLKYPKCLFGGGGAFQDHVNTHTSQNFLTAVTVSAGSVELGLKEDLNARPQSCFEYSIPCNPSNYTSVLHD